MSDTEVVVERRIAASVNDVWDALTDLESAPRILSGVERVEVLTPGPFGEGTRWRETRRLLGRQTTEEMYVTECEAPRHVVVESEAKGAHYVSEFDLGSAEKAEEVEELEEPGTTVRMTFTATPPGGAAGLLLKLFGGIGAKTVGKSVERDLADIAATVERPAPPEETAEGPAPGGPG